MERQLEETVADQMKWYWSHMRTGDSLVEKGDLAMAAVHYSQAILSALWANNAIASSLATQKAYCAYMARTAMELLKEHDGGYDKK